MSFPVNATETDCGFLVVKTFPRLYRDHAGSYNLTAGVYAIPRLDKAPEEYAIQYRGLDRDALRSNEYSNVLAEIRIAELEKLGKADEDGFLFSYPDALDVYNWLDDKTDYEIVWARTSSSSCVPPEGFRSIGYEPSYFSGDHFAAQCDCMLVPRWHGTDDEGNLFGNYFRKLNKYGLFNSPLEASEFLEFYLSFDWTEPDGDYVVIEVFVQEL